MLNTTVYVKNIASATEEPEIKDFFSFCGKITNIEVTSTGETKDATVTFEKETAAKTALLLNNTQLGSTHITVTGGGGGGDSSEDASYNKDNTNRDSDHITQEEKPRTRILAEYLAQGYVIGDAAIQRAIELDSQHGVSNRFFSTLQNLDQKYHATDRAKATDQSYGITAKAQGLFGSLSSYFEKATSSPTGKKIVAFYHTGSRQVQDIHTEARRLADLRKEEHGGSALKASGLDRLLGKEKEKPVPPATGETIGTQSPTNLDPSTAVPLSKPSAVTDEKSS